MNMAKNKFRIFGISGAQKKQTCGGDRDEKAEEQEECAEQTEKSPKTRLSSWKRDLSAETRFH
jgi:hypothetical protein